ncbi:MAG: M16 family metallopeptidase [Alcanivoracaceae bacterium]
MRFLAVLLFLLTTPGWSATDPVTHDFILDNGLRVLVREDHRAPVAVQMVWYKVGSFDEPPGWTGISHVLEHMLFKGTENFTAGDFSKLVRRFGGSDNAFTSYDYTAYFQKFEVSRLPLMMEIEADRMAHLVIDDEEFARELLVVLEERRQRTDDNPNGLAWEKFAAMTRPGSGYASPIIGWPTELDQLTAEQARDWYRRFYSPGNATLVIAGNVTVEQVRPLAERFYGRLPVGVAPIRPLPRLAAAPGERRLALRLPVQVPSLYMSWNVPTLVTHPDDFYALTMLAGVFDGGMSARLETDLVRGREMAAGAGAGYDGITRGDGLFTVTATPKDGVSLEALEKAIQEELGALRSTPPSEEEMRRVRAGVLSGRVFGMDSLFRQAMVLGQLATLNVDWRLENEFTERLAAVTPEDVQRVASTWLVSERLAVAQVLPEEKK